MAPTVCSYVMTTSILARIINTCILILKLKPVTSDIFLTMCIFQKQPSTRYSHPQDTHLPVCTPHCSCSHCSEQRKLEAAIGSSPPCCWPPEPPAAQGLLGYLQERGRNIHSQKNTSDALLRRNCC